MTIPDTDAQIFCLIGRRKLSQLFFLGVKYFLILYLLIDSHSNSPNTKRRGPNPIESYLKDDD